MTGLMTKMLNQLSEVHIKLNGSTATMDTVQETSQVAKTAKDMETTLTKKVSVMDHTHLITHTGELTVMLIQDGVMVVDMVAGEVTTVGTAMVDTDTMPATSAGADTDLV